MNRDSFAAEFRETFDMMALPEEISALFHITERLGSNEFGETFLLSKKTGGDLYVLKKCRKSDMAANEAEILHGLEHEGLPEYEKVIENESEIFVSRRYIKGVTLTEYISGGTTMEAVVDTMARLCDILEFLHSQPAPVIHRDIKPSNIIINTGENSVKLIDFGGSRRYSEDAKADTVLLGTHDFAPPEQYGFAQTDRRSDIYSLGVVLRYWLTGTADRDAEIKDKALAKIVAKCTALAPETRYQTAAAVKKALINYKNRTRRRVFAGIVCALAVCLVIATGLVIRDFARALPYIPTVEVRLAVEDAFNLTTHTSDIITITGNGTYTARIELDGGHRGFTGIGILADGALFENHIYKMEPASPAPDRFRNARIRYESVIINDTVSLEIIDNADMLVVGPEWDVVEGYVFSILWSGWGDYLRWLADVEAVPCAATNFRADMFTVPGVYAITSIEVVFTIGGVED